MSDEIIGIAILDNSVRPRRLYSLYRCGDGRRFIDDIPVYMQGEPKPCEPCWCFRIEGETLHFTPSVHWQWQLNLPDTTWTTRFHNGGSWSVRFQYAVPPHSGEQQVREANQAYEGMPKLEMLLNGEYPQQKVQPCLGKVRCFLMEPVGEKNVEVPNGWATRTIWRRTDTGELFEKVSDFPVGAMYFATWYRLRDGSDPPRYDFDWDNLYVPPLIVRTPGGFWNIDSRASNCTQKEDRQHRCWIRHGKPPDITVDKEGLTCHAGAGSIQCGDYHGFLRNGHLENC